MIISLFRRDVYIYNNITKKQYIHECSFLQKRLYSMFVSTAIIFNIRFYKVRFYNGYNVRFYNGYVSTTVIMFVSTTVIMFVSTTVIMFVSTTVIKFVSTAVMCVQQRLYSMFISNATEGVGEPPSANPSML